MLVQVHARPGADAFHSRPDRVFATVIDSQGQVRRVTSWMVAGPHQNFYWQATAVIYDPGSRGYRVAWMLSGNRPSVFYSRTLRPDGRPLTPPRLIARPSVSDQGQFDIASDPITGQGLAVWIQQRASQAARIMLAKRLDRFGHPVGPTIPISEQVDESFQPYDQIQAIAIGGRYVIWWRQFSTLRVADLPVRAGGARPVIVLRLRPAPSGGAPSVGAEANAVAGSLLITQQSDNPHGGNQVYAHTVALR
jgi:hypothetical protein